MKYFVRFFCGKIFFQLTLLLTCCDHRLSLENLVFFSLLVTTFGVAPPAAPFCMVDCSKLKRCLNHHNLIPKTVTIKQVRIPKEPNIATTKGFSFLFLERRIFKSSQGLRIKNTSSVPSLLLFRLSFAIILISCLFIFSYYKFIIFFSYQWNIVFVFYFPFNPQILRSKFLHYIFV